jgi:hypothetical protein
MDKIIANSKIIGTVHIGTEIDANDDTYIHLNLDPLYYESGYKIVEVRHITSSLYVLLQKEEA